MKPVFTAIACLILTALSSNGAFNLQWEESLTNYVDSVSNPKIKVYSNGMIVTALHSDPHDHLVVFNADGDLIFEEALPMFQWVEVISGHSSNPNFIVLYGWADTDYINRIYELGGNGYTSVTNVYGPNSFGVNNSMAGADPSVFIAIEDNNLRKYTLSPSPSTVVGSVSSGINGSNYIMHWDSKAGVSYQIQSSINLTNWVDVGGTISGTGSSLSWANALTNSVGFYRVTEN